MKYIVLSLVCTLMLPMGLVAQQGSWTETTRKDFSDGWYERDVYCSFRSSNMDTDSGAVEFIPRFDFTNDGWIDLVVSNKPNSSSSGLRRDWILLYTGDGDYSTDRYLQYATNNGAEIDGADLDLDGYADLIVCHYFSPDKSSDPDGAVTIYWGTADGPSPTDTTMLPASAQTEAVYVADLNKDGWIDILSGGVNGGNALAIFWGGPNRAYSNRKASYLPVKIARHNFEVADFDKDGYYDILVVNYNVAENYIYWGSQTGFHESNVSSLSFLGSYPHGSTVADFNNDGILDIVLTGTQTIREAYVYYGNGTRSYSKPIKLKTGPVFGGAAALDFNQDGWLDIIFYRGQADESENFKGKPWLYLGSAAGFSDSNKMEFGARKYNLSGGFLTDFNKDGILDLFVHSWDIFDSSGVMWGPDFNTHTQLYCNRDHHSQCRDMGHVYDRQQREPYISNIYDAGKKVNWDAFVTIDSTPGASQVRLFARTGPTAEVNSEWTSWVRARSNGSIPDIAPNGDTVINQFIQYKADMYWQYAAEFPVLFEITTYWGPQIIVEPDREDTTYPNVEARYNLTITNNAMANDVINISTEATSSGWQARLYDASGSAMTDNNSDGIVDVDSVDAKGGTKNFHVGITPPADASINDVDTTIVWIYSTNNETVKDSAVIITHIAPTPALLLTPNHDSSGYRGETIRYSMTLTNSGNAPDIVGITTQGTRTNWTVGLLDTAGLPLRDSDANGTPDLGTVPVGSRNFTVNVTIPVDANAGDIDSTLVVAHSSIDTTTSSAWLVTTTLVHPDTVLALRVNPDTCVKTYPETSVQLPMRVRNLGNVADTVDVEIRFIDTDMAWTYKLLDAAGNSELGDMNSNGRPDVGIVGKEAEKSFILEVTPPPDVGNNFTGTNSSGLSAVALVTVRSSIKNTVTDFAEDTIVVIPKLNVHNFPNPFVGSTTFYFSLPEAGQVSLKIYNRAGEYLATVVENKAYEAGAHFEPWDGQSEAGKPTAPGVLLYSFQFVPDDSKSKPAKIVKTALSQGGGR